MQQIRNLSLFFSLLLCLFAFASCKGDDDMTSDNMTSDGVLPSSVVTTYTGTLTHTSPTGEMTLNTNGTATIELDGDKYDINFSDGVPSISGLTFIESSGTYLTTSSGVTGISIDEDDLSVVSTQNGSNWVFAGSK